LLDDVLSELDKTRCHKLIETAASIGQVFITSTNEHALDELSVISPNLRKFFIKQGRIERVEDAAKIN
jgi:recombinational DNA repair ATPase RecF